MVEKGLEIWVFLLVFILFPQAVGAAKSYRAVSLREPDVQEAVTNCQMDDECSTVYLPPGNSPPWEDEVSFTGGMTIIGAGQDLTVINVSPNNRGVDGGAAFLASNAKGEWVRISSMSINSCNREISKPSAIAIKRTRDAGFRVDHITIIGSFTTGGFIGLKYVWKGLVDNVTLKDEHPGENLPYGITLGGPTWDPKPPECTSYDAECIKTWDTRWWDNTDPYPNGHDGHDFDENYLPGTGKAIFIEDCLFDNVRSAVMWNWSSKGAVVLRYSTFYSGYDTVSPVASAKPGAIWFDCYENDFYWTGEGQNTIPHSIRCSGTIHDNRYHNVSRAGYITCWSGYGYGHLYTPQVQMDELYIWNNTYDNCKLSGDSACDSPGDCGWRYVDSYNKVNVTCSYFFREPAPGDRIYPYRTYPYPHPHQKISQITPVFNSILLLKE